MNLKDYLIFISQKDAGYLIKSQTKMAFHFSILQIIQN